jgi:membrane protein
MLVRSGELCFISRIGWRQCRALHRIECLRQFPQFLGFMRSLGALVTKVYQNVMKNHIMALSAGLSYYFVMSLFPTLILAAALLSYVPVPHIFGRILGAMSAVVPADSMGLVRAVLRDVVSPFRGSFLTIGILGTIWTASSGFASLVEALNVSYGVPETRPIWKTRLVALQLMVVTGFLLVLGTTLVFLGPRFGSWLAAKADMSRQFVEVWPVIRWSVSIAFIVLAVELIFYWAPNVKQKFLATLPGAAIGVGFWIGASFALGYYFRRFPSMNHTYGTLAAAVALMVWLYWSWFVILIGAEINAELLKAKTGGKLELKQPPPKVVKAPSAWDEGVAA